MATNRECLKDYPFRQVESLYCDACRKGFNKGFEAWLDFPHFKRSLRIRDGKLMMEGVEYKGNFYSKAEFSKYKELGMLP